MTDRLYGHGTRMSGEVRHYHAWEHPTMPRLERPTLEIRRRRPVKQSLPLRKRGYISLLLDVIRAR